MTSGLLSCSFIALPSSFVTLKTTGQKPLELDFALLPRVRLLRHPFHQVNMRTDLVVFLLLLRSPSVALVLH